MINLDNNATTDLDPRVREEMFAYQQGNPSSMHAIGRAAKQRLGCFKRRVLDYFGMDQVIFTSGATEALNLAIRSLMRSMLHAWFHLGRIAKIPSVANGS